MILFSEIYDYSVWCCSGKITTAEFWKMAENFEKSGFDHNILSKNISGNNGSD